MKIYHTETREDYDALMVELGRRGCKWCSGFKMKKVTNNWEQHANHTCVRVDGRIAFYDEKDYYAMKYPNVPITKYKAKADEKMRFTKGNVYKLVERYSVDQGYLLGDLKSDISKLDDTPEKVVVPKFVAEFYEKRKYCILSVIFDEFKKSEERKVAEWYIDGQSGGRHVNGLANSQETIAKMHLYGYTIEPEQLYYIPLPHLKTSDGIQQVLSKRKNGTNYFASRPNENLKQRFTKDELAQVPVSYKPYAKPIEEESE